MIITTSIKNVWPILNKTNSVAFLHWALFCLLVTLGQVPTFPDTSSLDIWSQWLCLLSFAAQTPHFLDLLLMQLFPVLLLSWSPFFGGSYIYFFQS